MATSDSEDFESADEGNQQISGKRERKKRLSSSNYSDSLQSSDHEAIHSIGKTTQIKENVTDGWDDFEIDDSEPAVVNKTEKQETTKEDSRETNTLHKDKGWDEFNEWDTIADENKAAPSQTQDIKSVADRLSEASVKDQKQSWGWGGWGVDSLLSSASAGITSLTTQVSQGISTVLETGIGAPDPEALAKHNLTKESVPENQTESPRNTPTTHNVDGAEAAFPFGSIISGVTKFVETTGTKVIAGGLDTLETIGKKTMEVLQEGDPGLAKKRAMLGLDPGDKLVLSQVLREAKTRADEEDKLREERMEAKAVHYESLFDDFEGLVHLEALEMLSKQVNMKIEDQIRNAPPEKKQEIKETLQQVAELCEMPDEDEEEIATDTESSKSEQFHERLQEATQDLGLKLTFQPLVKQYSDSLEWLASEEGATDKSVYKKSVSSLAQCTSLAVELYHKTGELLLVKTRRSTADEADALTQLTVVLTRHVSDLATQFTDKLNSLPTDNKDQINLHITNVFLEAGNSSTYIQNAFHLLLPILQIGAT